MLAFKELGYIFLFFVAPSFGSIIGIFSGKLINHIIPSFKHSQLFDACMGTVGFFVGTYISLIGYSINERWVNGQLVFRETTGYGDYLFLFAIAGAVTLVLVSRIVIYIIRRVI